jgi:hypothetical protein
MEFQGAACDAPWVCYRAIMVSPFWAQDKKCDHNLKIGFVTSKTRTISIQPFYNFNKNTL